MSAARHATVRAALLAGAVACAAPNGAASGGGSSNGAAPPGETRLVLEVGPRRVPCVGVEPRTCLQVRTPPDTAWRLFHDAIDGFTPEDGVRYRVEVARTEVPRPPADGSRWRWRLVRVLDRVREAR